MATDLTAAVAAPVLPGPAGTDRAAAPAGGRRRVPPRLRRLARRPGFVVSVLLVLFVVVTAFAPGLFTSRDPYATVPAQRLRPPSGAHLFGTDDVGRDLWTRTLYGSELTVKAALIAVGIALVAGLTLGLMSGFFGRWADTVIMRVVDVQLAIPGLLFALVIVTALGFGTVPVAIAVGVASVPAFARTTRAEVLRVRTLPYVEAARAGGASWTRVLLRHVLPNSWGPVLSLAVLDFGTTIIYVAALSFLGFGAAPPRAEWGSLVANGRNFLITAPWVSLLPGAMVVLTVLALNHIAKSLQEARR
ncbi:ABC transporter permease [Nocardia sp. alder85J]|uniref:ABC transporter permease n=1 Tax=Nocardia sp. alder85J TaxID=2862949 RepID=UPI001CD19576|nr:ABC transporter permease [Nocardia sp. alder85J]MCX4095915.1 ABC transporter permease [Nocardia sp. alder85J]